MLDYKVQITCPEHQGRCIATLYQYPHKLAGIWECHNSDITGECEHEERHTETVESWPTSPLDSGHEEEIYVCDHCECTTEGDPAQDRYEDYVDMQIMEARGK